MADKNAASDGAPMAIDAQLVRQLAELLDETHLTEIEVQDGERRIRVIRQVQLAAAPAQVMAAAAPVAAPAPVPPAAAPAGDDFASHPGAVKSPMVGTVYLAPEPGAAAFIAEGATVAAGDTLLIIEAMKVMNPIKAPRGGTVAEVLVSDAQPVEFGEVLLIIE